MMKMVSVVVILAWGLLGSATAFSSQQTGSSRLSSELFARKPFITGNWKLNPSTKQEAIDLATGIADAVTSDSPCDVGLFVPFPFIETVAGVIGDKLVVGAEVSFSWTWRYR
jgi:triosephosphate isomerase